MRRKIPPLQALACFEAAARHQSYTRAALELALTQGAVSRRIAALEAFVGTALFRRTRHGVALTSAGAAYARRVGTRLDALERDTLDAMAAQGGDGALHVAAVPTFATRWLIPRLPDFARAHPEVTVHLETSTRPFLFADTPFDAALYAGTPEQVASWPGTRTTPLMTEEVVPVAAPALLGARRRWRPADIATLPLLQQSTRPEAWRDWFDAMGVDAPEAMRGPRYELFSMLAAAAAHGMGVALMPSMLIADELARGTLAVACDRPLRGRRGYHFVVPDTGAPRPAVDRFGQWLQEQAATP
jgi:LysR family glycine cleavage system transcriptional activator